MHFARLKNHDYRGEGYYFVTFATAPRRALLSEIRAGQIRIFPEGTAVVEAWKRIPADDPAYSLRINVELSQQPLGPGHRRNVQADLKAHTKL